MHARREKRNRFLLVYGSETGQAQAIAEEIAEKSPDFGLEADLHCLEQTGKKFNVEYERCLVVVTSTTGDGEPPANACKFVRRLKKKTLTSDHLSNLQYALLGLGDTNYTNFCRCARDLDNRFEQLGAKPFYPTGFADDGVGLEVVVEPWLEGLYPAVQKCLASIQDDTDSRSLSNGSGPHSQHNGDDCVVDSESVTRPTNSPSDSDSIPFPRIQLDQVQSDAADDKTTGSNCHIPTPPTPSIEIGSNESGLNHNTNHSVLETSQALNGLSVTAALQNVGQQSHFPHWETPCTRVDIELSSLTPNTSSLTCSLLPLSEKSLTVPALPPVFLEAKLSKKRVEISSLSHQNGCKLPSSASDVMHVGISAAKVLTHPQAVKKTLMLTLSLEDCQLTHIPGDSISIICPNSSSEVALLLERLGASDYADVELTLSVVANTTKRRAAVPAHVHQVTTLRHALLTCFNIREPPSKAFIRALVDHATAAADVRRMQELCSKEGAPDYTQFIREQSVSLLDFLYAFPSCQPPVERILEFLPRLLPRPYSVCSCTELVPNAVQIVFNVVEVKGSPESGHFYDRRGVCTGWLDDLTSTLQDAESTTDTIQDVKIPIFLRTNHNFRPPDDLSLPLVLIGPGTGVAPFIGFLQQRSLRRQALSASDEYGETWLFFGCRNKDKDFLFQEEVEELQHTQVISKLCVSFSRDADSSHRYVQDFMRAESSEVARLLSRDETLVYLCGDAKNMAKDVNAAFEDILQTEKGMSADDAHLAMMRKRLHKTYFEDVWV